ncbi:hypothetical protein [Pseudochryseolinea flava]|uniref:Uncharacterized protein n=1 Tax=Pseudochryseolinea flava TaxID=2059302 RepID=A0A364Y644_9BACT|nr:hypothetical protein [Pseudochryseolinea flava]RAW01831.1 hypothetical protein DQQ10_09310 [Pseudochryseolinea flava]
MARDHIFTFLLAPLFGALLEYNLPRRYNLYILIAASICLTPLLFKYQFSIAGFQIIFLFLAISSAYAYLSADLKPGRRIVSALVTMACLFFVLYFVAWAFAFHGTESVVKEWIVDDYRVQYKSDQGFAGQARMFYELDVYGMIPCFLKKVDTQDVDNDSVQTCRIKFSRRGVVFNKCLGTFE